MKNDLLNLLVISSLLLAGLAGCGPQAEVETSANLLEQLSNQLGDAMASVDESGRGTATIAQYAPSDMLIHKNNSPLKLLFPEAQAATCGAAEFGACTGGNTVTRNFGGCTIGGYTLSGTVDMIWSAGAACALTAAGAGQTIRIIPNYTVTAGGATLSVSKVASLGITLNWVSGANPNKVFNYNNDGIRRILTTSDNQTLIDLTTLASNVTITGDGRINRTMSGGSLTITNGVNGETCTFTPNALLWTLANCNCATQGTWTGTCSTTGALTLTMNSCGAATLAYTEDGSAKSKAISLDRCVQN